MNPVIRIKIVNLLTEHDRRESRKKYYNPYALSQYFAALQRVDEEIADGETMDSAIRHNFCGRLLDKILKVVA